MSPGTRIGARRTLRLAPSAADASRRSSAGAGRLRRRRRSASRRWRPTPPTCRSALVTENVTARRRRTRSSTRSPTHELELYRSDVTRSSDTADTLLRAPQRRTTRAPPPSCAPTRSRAGCSRAAPARRVQVRTDAAARSIELVARYAAPTHATSCRPTSRACASQRIADTAASPTSRPCRSTPQVRHGQRHDPLLAVRRDRRRRHPRRGRDAARRDLRRPTSTSGASCARRDASRSSTRRSPPTASRSPGPATRPRARRRVRQQRPDATRRSGSRTATAKGAYFGLDGQSKQRSFLASPLEFSRMTSGFAMRMHPILNSWKQHNGRRLRRADRHAGAHASATASSSSPAGRTATATSSTSSTATSARRSTRT